VLRAGVSGREETLPRHAALSAIGSDAEVAAQQLKLLHPNEQSKDEGNEGKPAPDAKNWIRDRR
jgi:hypothetical protein